VPELPLGFEPPALLVPAVLPSLVLAPPALAGCPVVPAEEAAEPPPLGAPAEHASQKLGQTSANVARRASRERAESDLDITPIKHGVMRGKVTSAWRKKFQNN
jgi:hypothetical protein